MRVTRLFIRFIYRLIGKRLMFFMSPDRAHSVLIRFAKIWQNIPGLRQLTRFMLAPKDSDTLQQNILGIKVNTPVGLSAGFDKNIELQPTMDMVGFGFMTGGSVTLRPRTGNQRPWFYRLPKTKSIVVHAGLANNGVESIIHNIKKNKKIQSRMPLFVSVAVVACNESSTDSEVIEDVCSAVDKLIQTNSLQAIEINISCPNVHDDQPFTFPGKLNNLLDRLDEIDIPLPVFIKMPNLLDIGRFEKLLDVINAHNIQGVTIANLVKDRENVQLLDGLPDHIKGGLSGAPCQHRSNDLIRLAYEKYGSKLVIIGVGGVFSADDAYAKIKSGASMVALITGLMFEGPQLVGDITEGLKSCLKRDGYKNITEAIGADVRKNKKSI